VSLELKSPDFTADGNIAKQFTCEGVDISPALSWDAPPAATQSFVLIADDPDAPVGTWVHWVLFAIAVKHSIIMIRNGPDELGVMSIAGKPSIMASAVLPLIMHNERYDTRARNTVTKHLFLPRCKLTRSNQQAGGAKVEGDFSPPFGRSRLTPIPLAV